MIDLLSLNIPFKRFHPDTGEPLYVLFEDSRSGHLGGLLDSNILLDHGMTLRSGSVTKTESGLDIQRLYKPFESLRSSFSSIAYTCNMGNHLTTPYVQLKASPAKVIQGHNVFGSDNPSVGAYHIISSFLNAYPEIGPLLDFESISISQIDITYHARVKNNTIARRALEPFKKLSTGQIKVTDTYDTAVLFNAGSKKIVREIYLKHEELQREIKKIQSKLKKSHTKEYISHLEKRLSILQSSVVQEFANSNIRFEAKIKSDFLHRRGISTNLIEFCKRANNTNLIKELWNEAFIPLIDKVTGDNVNVYNESEVLEALISRFRTYKVKKVRDKKSTNMIEKTVHNDSRVNKAYELFTLCKTLGFETAKEIKSKSTFYRTLSDLTEVVPLSTLQSLNKASSNVVPLLNIINLDLENQLPENFVEPTFELKLVS